MGYFFFFFFSSRRRHTRYWRDWSSDVCSSDLGLQRRPRGELPALDDVGLDERPRRVADRRDRLPRLEERADERDGRRVAAQLVGVRDAAREQQRVVVAGVRVLGRLVGGERVALVEVVEGLDVALLHGDELDRRAGRLERL